MSKLAKYQRRVKYVEQTKCNNCMSACIAMVTGLPLEQVCKEFHEGYFKADDCDDYLSQYLTIVGAEHKRVRNSISRFLIKKGELAIITVPSLSGRGELHAIVVDTRYKLERIYDPSFGEQYVSDHLVDTAKGKFPILLFIKSFVLWPK